MEILSPVDMKTGLVQIKTITRDRIERYNEGIILISGLQGTGKTTVVNALKNTGIGGLVKDHKLVTYDEIPYKSSSSNRSLIKDLYNGRYPEKLRGKLLLGDIAGGTEIDEAFKEDERLIMVKLYCNLPTRSINLLSRIKYRILYHGYSPNEVIKSFISEINPSSTIKAGVANVHPDVYMETSIGKRLSPRDARIKLISS